MAQVNILLSEIDGYSFAFGVLAHGLKQNLCLKDPVHPETSSAVQIR